MQRFLLPTLLLAACGTDSSSSFVAADAQAPQTIDGALPPAVAGRNNRAPVFAPIAPQTLGEDESLELHVDATDPDDDPLRVRASGLPPGARWNEATRTLSFRPDFI